MAIVKVKSSDFDTEIMTSERVVLLDFYADWCGPCRMIAPIIEEIADERSDILVGKVNVDETPELAARFGIVSIPTLIILNKGEVVNKIVGARPKAEILSLLEVK